MYDFKIVHTKYSRFMDFQVIQHYYDCKIYQPVKEIRNAHKTFW
jgi:hypothetical protein